MRTTSRFSSITTSALALSGVLLLAACSGGGPGGAEVESGPLDEYFSALWDGEEYTQEQADKEEAEVQDLIAECMAEEGFEYIPVTGNYQVMTEEDEDGPVWGSPEFAEQYGYGIVDWPGMEGMESEEVPEDPNYDYMMSLSESEQIAYNETLNGPMPTEEEMAAMEEGEGMEYSWENAGCYGKADHEVRSNPAMDVYEDPEFAELMEAVDSLYMEATESDEVAALDRGWAECMADAGYSEFTDKMTAQETLQEEWNDAQMPDGPDGEYREPDEAAKKEFQEREIEVATVDATCTEKVDYEKKSQQIFLKAQEEFVEAHRAELDAMVAKYGVEKSEKN